MLPLSPHAPASRLSLLLLALSLTGCTIDARALATAANTLAQAAAREQAAGRAPEPTAASTSPRPTQPRPSAAADDEMNEAGESDDDETEMAPDDDETEGAEDRRGSLPAPASTPRPRASEWSEDPTAVPFRPWSQAGPDEAGEPDLEALVLKYTNAARAAEGKGPLRANVRLNLAGRLHSKEMLDKRYFAHESPVEAHRTPSMRARRAGYFGGAAENIFDFTAKVDIEDEARGLVDGWMKSPGHRRNILDDNHEMGIGVWRARGRLMATQLFGKQPFDYRSLTLSQQKDGYLLSAVGEVNAWSPYRAIRVRIDEEEVSLKPLAVKPGEPFRFTALVPKGGAHEVVLAAEDPADGGSRYWIFKVIAVDTSRPLAQAFQSLND
ncbi:MAG: CAP domain-containing protein [Candidatus Sericytochromatia bacterium]|nr:CAP domain-containing protein [Candidatus Sericytochromatia bacterium]